MSASQIPDFSFEVGDFPFTTDLGLLYWILCLQLRVIKSYVALVLIQSID